MSMPLELDHTTHFQPQTASDPGTFSGWDDPNPSTPHASDPLVYPTSFAANPVTNPPQVVIAPAESPPGSHSAFSTYPHASNRNASALAPVTDYATLHPNRMVPLPETFPMLSDGSNMQQLDDPPFPPAPTQNDMTELSPQERMLRLQRLGWLHLL
jgi:hypothetical protein